LILCGADLQRSGLPKSGQQVAVQRPEQVMTPEQVAEQVAMAERVLV
jgi:hypothetical protein